jgi:hypothetical protein
MPYLDQIMQNKLTVVSITAEFDIGTKDVYIDNLFQLLLQFRIFYIIQLKIVYQI